MTLDSDVAAPVESAWAPLPGCGAVRVGQVAPPRRVVVSDDGLARMRTAIQSVIADVVQVGIADVCADPLVFALTAGLPRLTGFDKSIDGGSAWRDEAPIVPGQLYAVSEIAEVAERRTSGGQRMVRVAYLTTFTDQHGQSVGSATGTSVHLGAGT
ncbi:MAG: hypothetical protein ABW137_35615 [Mycobacterium sp.]